MNAEMVSGVRGRGSVFGQDYCSLCLQLELVLELVYNQHLADDGLIAKPDTNEVSASLQVQSAKDKGQIAGRASCHEAAGGVYNLDFG